MLLRYIVEVNIYYECSNMEHVGSNLIWRPEWALRTTPEARRSEYEKRIQAPAHG
jgi:hypothetical protein